MAILYASVELHNPNRNVDAVALVLAKRGAIGITRVLWMLKNDCTPKELMDELRLVLDERYTAIVFLVDPAEPVE